MPEKIEPESEEIPARIEPEIVEPLPVADAVELPFDREPVQPVQEAPAPSSGSDDTSAGPTADAEGFELDAPGGADLERAFPAPRSTLSGLACARAFSASERPIGCDGATQMDFSRYANRDAAAAVDHAVERQFNALAGLYGFTPGTVGAGLPGQQGTQVLENRRMGTSGADQMRDSLPPMTPDPAFGD